MTSLDDTLRPCLTEQGLGCLPWQNAFQVCTNLGSMPSSTHTNGRCDEMRLCCRGSMMRVRALLSQRLGEVTSSLMRALQLNAIQVLASDSPGLPEKHTGTS